jgi:hypothetical protein
VEDFECNSTERGGLRMELRIIGLGKMGGNIALQCRKRR